MSRNIVIKAARTLLPVIAISVTAILTAHAGAAVVSGALITPTGPEDLTADGTTDWAVWNYTTNPISGTNKTIAPSNRKAGVTAVIGSATTLVGAARGTTSTPPSMTYTYTDGASPTSLTAATQGEIFDTSLADNNAGVTVTITAGQAGVPQVARIFVTGFNANPTFTASLPGATAFTDNAVSYPANARPPREYVINFTPDNTGDLLTITYQTANSLGANGNVDLQAVTVAPAPEPATLGALAVAAATTHLSRRRRLARR